MHHYVYTWGKESDGEFTYYPYSLEVTVKLPAGELWKEWEQCFTDVDKSWLWPKEFSRPKFETLPPRSGAKFVLDYEMPNFKKPSAERTDITYDYEMEEWNPEGMSCKYVGVGRHVFRGGGQMTIKPIDENSCTFRWEGRYKYKPEEGSKSLEYQFPRYFNTFLIKAAENIQEKTGY
jgi:hypothetical protein